MLVLALVVAHYREALTHGIEAAQSEAVKAFLASPFGLTELSSWLLFAVSMGFGLAALFDGYKMSDPYPGYKKVYVKKLEGAAAYEDGLGQLRKHIGDQKTDMLKRLDTASARAQGSIDRMRELINRKATGCNRIGNQLQISQQWLDLVLKTFQTANIEGRIKNGHPIPERFLHSPEVPLLPLEFPNFDTNQERAILEKSEAMVNDFVRQEPVLRATIQSAYNQRSNALETLHHHFAKPEASPEGDSPPTMATLRS